MTKSEIRDKQIYLHSIIFEVQAAAINFNPFQSSSVLPIGGICFSVMLF